MTDMKKISPEACNTAEPIHISQGASKHNLIKSKSAPILNCPNTMLRRSTLSAELRKSTQQPFSNKIALRFPSRYLGIIIPSQQHALACLRYAISSVPRDPIDTRDNIRFKAWTVPFQPRGARYNVYM